MYNNNTTQLVKKTSDKSVDISFDDVSGTPHVSNSQLYSSS